MDFAEFSDIETVGFATYKQKLQEQFQKEVKQEMVSLYADRFNSSASREFFKAIPGISHSIQFVDILVESARLDKEELPDKTANNIFSRVTSKFNETIDYIGKYVHVIQGKLSVAEEQLKIKQATINSLTVELDQMKDTFLDETKVADETLEIKRLKYQLKASDKLSQALQRKIRDLKQNHQQKVLTEEKAQKVKAIDNSDEIKELKKIIEQLNQRNLELGKRLVEKKPVDNIEQITSWVADKVADAFGFKNIRNIVDNVFKTIQICIYAYTLFRSINNYYYWLNNTWNKPEHKYYAASAFSIIIFCMLKLLTF
jgi:hypothetical protein